MPPPPLGLTPRRTTAWGASLSLHALLAALLALGTFAPPAAQKEPETSRVIEVEFIEAPVVVTQRQAAAPQRAAPQPDPVQAQAPPRPAPKPAPATAAAPRRAPKPLSKPVVSRPVRVTHQAPELPVNQTPSPEELIRLAAAARAKRSESDAATRLANLREEGTPQAVANGQPDARQGTASVRQARPQGELSGRGVLSAPSPQYPEVAQRNIWEGTAQIRVYVNPDGSVRDAEVVGSSGFAVLDAAARRAATGYQFTPLAGGESQIESGVIPFSFVIR
ncbi:MAG: energy transducer TonB [Candidatus Sericytochromatia bacterium]|nr:energy transducer TonB [Candidatus Sericytochromatia bacterium]